jgi:hypothetical protein
MIFLEGDGACFNGTTCNLETPSSFTATDFNGTFESAEGNQGIFNRSDAANPVSDWSHVYVPYCTGDIHAGNNVTSADAGAGVADCPNPAASPSDKVGGERTKARGEARRKADGLRIAI